MDENSNLNEGQEEVVDPQTNEVEEIENDDLESGEVESEESEEPEVADPEETKQTPEQDAIYKKMRLKAQEEATKELGAERQRIEAEKAELERLHYEREAQQAEQRVMSNLLTEENIEAKEYELGVNRDVAIKLIQSEAQSLIHDERNKVKSVFEANQKQKESLKSAKYFNELEKEAEDLMRKTPGIDFHTAFHHLRSMKLDDLEKKSNKNAEKKTLADVQDRARRKPLTSDGGSDEHVNPSSILSNEEMEMTMAMGNNPKNIAKYLKNNLKNKKG